MNRIAKDPLQRRLEIVNWVLLAVLAAASFLWMSRPFGLGVLVGGLISIVNFHWLYFSLCRVFRNLGGHARLSLLARYYVRFIVTGVALYFVITRLEVDIVGLVIGLSTVVLAIVGTTVALLQKKKGMEEV